MRLLRSDWDSPKLDSAHFELALKPGGAKGRLSLLWNREFYIWYIPDAAIAFSVLVLGHRSFHESAPNLLVETPLVLSGLS